MCLLYAYSIKTQKKINEMRKANNEKRTRNLKVIYI
jgi:hypothetical protein